jgi:hypothetical protein
MTNLWTVMDDRLAFDILSMLSMYLAKPVLNIDHILYKNDTLVKFEFLH